MYKLSITQKKTGNTLCIRGDIQQIKQIIPMCNIPGFNVACVDKMQKPIEVNTRNATILLSSIPKDAGKARFDLDLIIKLLTEKNASEKVNINHDFLKEVAEELKEVLSAV